ncbi:MAG: efflux RND transporter permease subunit [Terricaulis sp.]
MLKGLVEWWGRNPVAGNLLMLACAALGIMSFLKMEKEFWPAGRGDGVQIEAIWPGASPQDMETQVVQRIEEATADLDGINWERARSQESYGYVRLVANPGVDVDALTADARSRVEALSGLPVGMEPIRVTREVGRDLVMILSIHGNVDERLLRDTAQTLRDRIANLPGAANTVVWGARSPEVSIELSETSLREYGLTFDEVARAVRAASLDASAGAVRTSEGDYQLRTRNLADTALDFGSIIVRQSPEGGVIRVDDIATVNDGFQDVNVYSRLNGEPAISVAILSADQFNIWDTEKAVQELLTAEREALPRGLTLTTVYNEVEDYNMLLGQLFQNALQGFGLIFLLLLLSLHPKVAVWATIGVITAFAGSFFILPYLNVSLNFMSVFAFLLVLGIMVDDAIIVGEAIYERAEQGHSGADASIYATQLVLKPLVASVLVTMLAFSPWMLLSGDVQQFTRAISIVVMSTLVFSLIESLIILPAHLGHVTKPDPNRPGWSGRFMRVQQACAHSVLWVASHIHGPFLRGAVKLRWLTLACFIVVFMLSLGLMQSHRIKQSFMPEIEGDFLQVSIELPQTTPFSRMTQVAAQLDAARNALEAETSDVAYRDPNTGAMSHGVVRSWSQSIEEHAIRAYVGLTPPETRELRSSEVTNRLKELLGPILDAERVSLELNSNDAGASIQIAVMGESQDDLRIAVDELKARLLQFSAVTSVRDSEEAANEELQFSLLPGAEQLGITIADVTRQARQAYFGEEVQRLPREGDDVRVYVRYPRDDRRSLESLGAFRVRTADGREVPLASVATWRFEPGVTGLDRRQRMRSILVEAEAPNDQRGPITDELEKNFFGPWEAAHPTITRKAIGEAEGQQKFINELLSLGLMALFAMYFLLAVTFRSYWQPALIMSAIPFAFIGAAVGHWVFGVSFGLFSVLGMVAAIGVVVNDNVVLVDRCNQIRGFFALRRKRVGLTLPEGVEPLEFENGAETFEIVKISEDWEPHNEFIAISARSDFAEGPIERLKLKQVKGEFFERSQELEAHGFQIMRVKAFPAITGASVSRFRQIFLTSVTEFVGTSPMLLENAAIVQFLKPMIVSLAFGVLLCMPVTLILTPCFYVIGLDVKRAIGGVFGYYGRLYGGPRRDKLAAAE